MNKRIAVIFALSLAVISAVMVTQPALAGTTCPSSGEWTKIDSGDLSLYPVVGAVEYCFKAGNWEPVSSIPAGGFGQPGGGRDANCNTDIKYCDLSHWSYRLNEPQPTPTSTEEPQPTSTPTDVPTDVPYCETYPDDPECQEPTPTPTEEPECEEQCEPTPTPTDEPRPTPTPEITPELPKAGFVSQGEIMNGEPWQLTVPGNVWAGHNQEGWPAGEWWKLWEGIEFEFQGQWYTVVEYVIADPTEVELIGQAVDFDLMLITCRNYDPITNTWAERLVIYANLSN